MAVRMTPDEFDTVVDEALALIPGELLDQVENCVIVVEATQGPDEQDLLGYYSGIPLSERDSHYSGVLPDRIVLFREAILGACESRADAVEQIRITVWHELAHYFGIDDEHLDEWGYG